MKLDQFLKWNGWVSTGGEAKQVIIAGRVRVNGLVETRRGRKLKTGDQIVYENSHAYISQNGPSAT